MCLCVCAGKKADFGSRSRSPVYPENYDVQINGIFIWPSMLHLIPSSFLLSFSVHEWISCPINIKLFDIFSSYVYNREFPLIILRSIERLKPKATHRQTLSLSHTHTHPLLCERMKTRRRRREAKKKWKINMTKFAGIVLPFYDFL